MKDKEMVNCFNCVCKPVCMKTADINKEQELLSWNEYIKQYGCKHYQPKPPEDSVVNTPTIQCETYSQNDMVMLSREEYEKQYDKNWDNYREGENNAKVYYENIIIPKVKEQERKETAEKILKGFKNNFVMFDKKDAISIDLFIALLEKLAKQFGAEIKE